MTTKTIEPGFFVMDDTHIVLAMPNLDAGKQFALDKVAAMPTARIKNIRSVTTAIERVRTLYQLSTLISNHVLKHTSEGLGVIK